MMLIGSLLGWFSIKILLVGPEIPLVRAAHWLVGPAVVVVGGEKGIGIWGEILLVHSSEVWRHVACCRWLCWRVLCWGLLLELDGLFSNKLSCSLFLPISP